MIFEHYVIIFLVLLFIFKAIFNNVEERRSLEHSIDRTKDLYNKLDSNYRDKYDKERSYTSDLLLRISDLEYKLEQSNDERVKYYKDVLTKVMNENTVVDLNNIVVQDNAKETLVQVIGNKKAIIQNALTKY